MKNLFLNIYRYEAEQERATGPREQMFDRYLCFSDEEGRTASDTSGWAEDTVVCRFSSLFSRPPVVV